MRVASPTDPRSSACAIAAESSCHSGYRLRMCSGIPIPRSAIASRSWRCGSTMRSAATYTPSSLRPCSNELSHSSPIAMCIALPSTRATPPDGAAVQPPDSRPPRRPRSSRAVRPGEPADRGSHSVQAERERRCKAPMPRRSPRDGVRRRHHADPLRGRHALRPMPIDEQPQANREHRIAFGETGRVDDDRLLDISIERKVRPVAAVGSRSRPEHNVLIHSRIIPTAPAGIRLRESSPVSRTYTYAAQM
jgi:hypothetical protein